MSTKLFAKGERAVGDFESNFHTGIDLINHPPNDVGITDQSLTEFAYSLETTRTEIERMKTVGRKVISETIQTLSNANNIEKIFMSECHLCNCGRNDSGFDLVVLMKEGENLHTTTDCIKERVHALTATSVGRLTETTTGLSKGTEGASAVERHEAKTAHATTLHFEHDGVHVNIAVGTSYGLTEESNRQKIWDKIDQLDKGDKLKKVQLDQFAIDLYESMTLFMNNHVRPEAAELGNEKFLQGALRLARAWRQCCLSSRDIQFSPLDAWLIMLNAVHTELVRHPHGIAAEKKEGAAGIGGAVSGVRKALKDLFKGKQRTSGTEEGGLSMKAVMKEFLNQMNNLESMNISFTDFYSQDKIPGWIKTQRPLVLDPVCPYRNTVYNLHKQVNEDIKKHANECMKMLDDPNATLTKLFHLTTYKRRGA
jgi:hypothetical protein